MALQDTATLLYAPPASYLLYILPLTLTFLFKNSVLLCFVLGEVNISGYLLQYFCNVSVQPTTIRVHDIDYCAVRSD